MDGYLGEIRMFAGNYAPEGWALCNGQLLSLSQNQALYSLIGKTYGGDGVTNFALPDLRGRVPVHQGLTYNLASAAGTETTTMTDANMPAHTHVLNAQSTAGTTNIPTGGVFANTGAGDNEYTNAAGNVTLGIGSLSAEGGNQAFNNIQPSLPISFIIALQGNYPTPNN